MSLSQTDVEQVSLLARLQLSPAEIETMTRQLGQILEYVEQLAELDTRDVQPMAHAVEFYNVLVPDKQGESLPREQALANASSRDDQCYRVPAVLGD